MEVIPNLTYLPEFPYPPPTPTGGTNANLPSSSTGLIDNPQTLEGDESY